MIPGRKEINWLQNLNYMGSNEQKRFKAFQNLIKLYKDSPKKAKFYNEYARVIMITCLEKFHKM